MNYGIGFLVIFVLYLIAVASARYAEWSDLDGMWSIDSEFCCRSGLTTGILDISSNMGSKSIYLLLTNSDAILINDAADLEFSISPCGKPYQAQREWDVTFNWSESSGGNPYPLWDKTQSMVYYPHAKKIIFHTDGKINFIAYKDYALTDTQLIPDRFNESNYDLLE